MEEVYRIIGLRDIKEELLPEFKKLSEEGSIEANQIRHGYTNPLVLANVLKFRAKCLEECYV